MNVDAARLRHDLETLGQIGRTEAGGISRTTYSPADLRAREWYRERASEAGLVIESDGLGNLVARAAKEPVGAPIWSGSHIDTVPNGGAFDGALGAVAALECLRRLVEQGVELQRPVRAVVFADEEGNYTRRLGSVALSRGLTEEQLRALVGRDGDRLVDRLAELGMPLSEAAKVQLPPGAVDSFVELHIEQGPYLEADGYDIGVVTSIVGLWGARLEFLGLADHAGTTPMTHRRDALRGAADFLVQVPGIAASVSDRAVATCGSIKAEPGGSNVVPAKAFLTLDFRAPEADQLQALGDQLYEAARQAADRHQLELRWNWGTKVDPVALSDDVRDVVADAAKSFDYTVTDLSSGAGHDAQGMAEITRAGMIFVPSVGGRSHCPEELTSWEDVERGANVLLQSLLTLATAGEQDEPDQP